MSDERFSPYIIPDEILEAATKVSMFFKKHNSKGWQLLDICDRSFARNSYNSGLEVALSLVKEINCPHCSDSLICGIENSKNSQPALTAVTIGKFG